MPEQTSRIVLGLLMVCPGLIESTDELNDSIFSGKDRKTFQAIGTIWENDRPELIDINLLLSKLDFDGKTAYVSELLDASVHGSRKEEAFKSLVGQLVKKKLAKEIVKKLNDQSGTGEFDIDELKPLLMRYEVAGDRDKKLAQDVRDWVTKEARGEFNLRQIYAVLGVLSLNAQASVRQVLARMVKEGVIDHAGKEYGRYRVVGRLADPIDLMATVARPVVLYLPLGLGEIVNLYPKSIIIIAGEGNRGKTALALDFVKHNMATNKVLYFFKEGGPEELRSRLELHQDIAIEDWKMLAFEHQGHIADVIDPDAINVYDYLHVTSEGFYKVDDMLNAVHDKLRGGVAFINIQKSSHKELGDGGEFSLRVPRLYVTLSADKNVTSPEPDIQYVTAKVAKAKGWKNGVNPDGRVFNFGIRNGWEIVPRSGGWEFPESLEAVRKTKLFGR